MDIGGLALLIGVAIDRCSSLHLSDGIALTAHAVTKMNDLWTARELVTISDEVREQYPSDNIIGEREGWVNGHPWTKARDEADRRGLIRRGRVGSADCMLFRAMEVLHLLEEVRINGPFGNAGT